MTILYKSTKLYKSVAKIYSFMQIMQNNTAVTIDKNKAYMTGSYRYV